MSNGRIVTRRCQWGWCREQATHMVVKVLAPDVSFRSAACDLHLPELMRFYPGARIESLKSDYVQVRAPNINSESEGRG